MLRFITGLLFVYILSISSLSASDGVVSQEKHLNLSLQSHFIENGADADSYSIRAEAGISSKQSLGIEWIRINDEVGSITLGSLYTGYRFYQQPRPDGVQVAALGGLRFLDGNSSIAGNMNSDGVVLGLAAEAPLGKGFTGCGRTAVSFLDDTLTELELTVGYMLKPGLELTGGYKTYFVNGDSLGGITIGVAGTF